MARYVVNTGAQQQEMLKEIGYDSFAELFEKAGVAKPLGRPLGIKEGMTEFEALAEMKELAGRNHVFKTVFRGAGSYRHYIPSVVKNIVSRNEFVTAYTPYQAEISQGVLQSIFEYQTEICALTGMDVSNASVYDGASAVAEAAEMCTERNRNTVILAGNINPMYAATVKTYHQFGSLIIKECGLDDLSVDDGTAAVVVQYPDYCGNIIDLKKIREQTAGTKLVVIVDPVALAVLEAPGNLGADICVGEAQQLGMPMSFGGPYLGFMACKEALTRRLPGRIVGQTVDANGKRCYTLTLQAREQHIRREKASSSICSNEALCAFTAAVYLGAVGPQGLREVALTGYQTAHYLQEKLQQLGFRKQNTGEFFSEFVTDSPVDTAKLEKHLMKHDILCGLPLEDNRILWAATEVNTREEIDKLAELIQEVL
ncbi:MAG: aminomethyl-transferring glycine dehydrogenase subunit GcvPA [Erysipelotrichaceae bacterium]|nr:aminomethyl-transferring glycine dehydrogenase subunit GcvPA [Erysipelotrichaceae bacterium]